ncbi:MAG: L-threonine 3-dehydrogenase [Deltaproteobacteria bacterium]|nr:L-threonine 3-dehydrogenase [Deltaproteobacteria bacterium]
MKALVKKYPKEGLMLEDIPKPTIGDGEVLIKINKTAICGSDVHIYKWDSWAQKNVPVPMQTGHEFMGEIVDVGYGVRDFKVGQRVSGEGHIVCGHCRNCSGGRRHLCNHTLGVGINRPGAFAEYLSIPASNVFLIPHGVSDDEAAILDPLGNAVHTTLSYDLVGEDILITGAVPIGIMAGVIAKHAGASHVVITDINEYRLNLAAKLGIKNCVNVKTTRLKDVMDGLNMTEGFDVGLEMSGSPQALGDMLENMAHGGKVALLGILPSDTKINWEHVIFKGLKLKGIYGREIFETWYKMCAMIQTGLNIKPIFTHYYKVEDFEQGFKVMASGNSGKVIIEWGEGA